ncbi:MAG: DNA modification methylase [Parcubacteria group bacterium]|nr:DNA modification methylase [Parcubacteria group bacterium]
MKTKHLDLKIEHVSIDLLKPSEHNPRRWAEDKTSTLRESIRRFGLVDPIICNSATGRENVVIGGNFRLSVAKELGFTEVPVVFVKIEDLEKERELTIRLNKNTGEWDLDLLAAFDEALLKDIGFSSEELDDVFADLDPEPETFDLKHELEKIGIEEVTMQKGDIFDLDGSRLMCGDSTIKEDILTLMNGERSDLCFTDPPYILDYTKGKKRHGKATEGFGYKRDRKYLETDVLPENFTDLWMANIAEVQKENFSIVTFENPKNLKTIWEALEKYWKYRNTIVWHIPNRVQGFAAKHRLFNKHDVALVGTSGDVALNQEPEDELFQNEYETAIFATGGKPHWESYGKGKEYCPTDFVEHIASDEKNSGQGIIFGTKPVEILIPYIKVLTKRGDLVLEPFGGSGSTLIASVSLGRRCYVMEKVPTYAEVIIARWEKHTGKKARKIT